MYGKVRGKGVLIYGDYWRSYFDGIMDFFGIVVGRGSHQTDDETLKFASQLIFQIFNQVLLEQQKQNPEFK